jgi:hypothetical protein
MIDAESTAATIENGKICAPHKEIKRHVDQAILGVTNNALMCLKLNFELSLMIRRVAPQVDPGI